MSKSFGRNCQLTLARPLAGEFFKTNPLNAVLITELKMVFKVTKTLKPEPNTCEITVHNLNEASRSEFAKLPLRVRLDAGYGGLVERVFEGDLRWSKSKHDQTEWLTRLECGDGDRAYRFASISKSFKAGTDPRALVKELAKSMGLAIPTNVDQARELAKAYSSGTTLDGESRVEMTRVLKRQGMGWSVQDGRLQVLGVDALEGTAFELSGDAEAGDTGLIGSPELSAPAKPGALPTLKLKHTLFPALTPGRKITLRSSAIPPGVYRITQVTHVGDTFGPDWYTELEATPL